MIKKSFKLKIFLIFAIPSIALLYFSFYFLNIKYKELNESSAFMLSANITKSISSLIHNIQLERGLSGGFIVAENRFKYKHKLLQQQKLTDEAYKNFLFYIKYDSKDKQRLIPNNSITFPTLPNS
jgi:methyl-accepting chemotaxis protein